MTTKQKSLPPNVLTMVRDRLLDDGYDGLYTDDCGCDLNALAPCAGIGEDCRAGYKVPCDCSDGACEHDWQIVPTLPEEPFMDDGMPGLCGPMAAHPIREFLKAEPTSASPPRFRPYPPPGVAVSTWCRTSGMQLCHVCDDLGCGDNLVETLRKKKGEKEERRAMRKPSVTGYGGQYDKFYDDNNGGGTVEWQPGDGTRYLLVVRVLDDAEARMFGALPDGMLVSVGAGGVSMLTFALDPYVLHHISWVREKADHMKITDYTILAYTALLNLVLGDELYGVELYGEMIKRR